MSMISALLIKTIKNETGMICFPRYVPEKQKLPAITYELIRLDTKKLASKGTTKLRNEVIQLNVFSNSQADAMKIRSQLIRLFEDLLVVDSYDGYDYECYFSAINAVDLSTTNTYQSSLDIHVKYAEFKQD
ncbi:hypothetical protein [Aeromonas veronii]|uniref:hypothetical protein n=1 Tax=Aeromonas veronii TaxID=654 RepID=UPI003D1C0F4E